MRRFGEFAERAQNEIAELIAAETRKPHWESAAEARLIAAKVKISIDAYETLTPLRLMDLSDDGSIVGRLDHGPVGVVLVLGPFNFPAHLPNGHLVPAILAGNSVIFKPSQWTPRTGQRLVELWRSAGLPEHVLTIVEGDGSVGSRLVGADIDGVCFTGSSDVGTNIHRQLAGRPDVMLALEMGGNNPIVVGDVDDLMAVSQTIAISAFISAGQRCTCARRAIIGVGDRGDALVQQIVRDSAGLLFGLPDDTPEPFMGPVIHTASAACVIGQWRDLVELGGDVLLPLRQSDRDQSLLSPGIIDMTNVDREQRDDEEIFGPVLQIFRTSNFDESVEIAAATRYGLAATLMSDHREQFETFRRHVHAGVVNWNRVTVGASGKLPFGGLGMSGNHRPSGHHAALYCSDAVAGIETSELSRPAPMPGTNFGDP